MTYCARRSANTWRRPGRLGLSFKRTISGQSPDWQIRLSLYIYIYIYVIALFPQDIHSNTSLPCCVLKPGRSRVRFTPINLLVAYVRLLSFFFFLFFLFPFFLPRGGWSKVFFKPQFFSLQACFEQIGRRLMPKLRSIKRGKPREEEERVGRHYSSPLLKRIYSLLSRM